MDRDWLLLGIIVIVGLLVASVLFFGWYGATHYTTYQHYGP
jgi:hypothetical protein